MNSRHAICILLALVAAWCGQRFGHTAEIIRLTEQSWDELAPHGKEVDCIYGDFVLRNEHLVAVIADPLPTRNANLTIRNIGGMLLDFTRRQAASDQLGVYSPNGMPISFTEQEKIAIEVDGQPLALSASVSGTGKTVSWRCSATAQNGLEVTVHYQLADGMDYLAVDTTVANPTGGEITQAISDLIRADRTFEFGNDAATGLFWAHDDWWQQAYGVLADERQPKRGGNRGSVIELQQNGNANAKLAAGQSITIRRKLLCGANNLEVRAATNRLAGQTAVPLTVQVKHAAGPVRRAKVSIFDGETAYGSGRTDSNGTLAFAAPVRKLRVAVQAITGETAEQLVDLTTGSGESGARRVEFALPEPGYVAAVITDDHDEPLPCKIAFHGQDGTPDPDFGPDGNSVGVKNLHYSHNGIFRRAIGPGSYNVIISYGPEYDAVVTKLKVERGAETKLAAKLTRVVDTSGWVSSDFHSHASPSGDNVSSQRGRVLNLLCEHVEFCPCTEHNRVDSYVPHLKELKVEHLFATCTGMELTGSLLPVNHQNAFPLLHKPRTQDGGGPAVDGDPVVQIERLALWDNGSEKLVQENHPNLMQIFGDRDTDGTPDEGFQKMFGFMDVMEVHPPQGIFTKPEREANGQYSRNPIFHWMQLLNLGYRIPGVVNTDAHYTYHDSGWLRNYIKSGTDDPAKIDTMEMVRASERGNVTMTTGPFLEVSLRADQTSAKRSGIPGEDVIAPGGAATLNVRVQCPNWFDINRVQVFVNGRAAQELNFTRRDHADQFSDSVVRFERKIPLRLAADAHIIVAAIGDGLKLGPVMGPKWGETPPVAVSNPIFVDLAGDGFQANQDLLDLPLPRK